MATVSLTQNVVLPQALSEANVDFQVLVPGDAEYDVRQQSYWSQQEGVKPACIALPRSAEEVSAIVRMLAARQSKFAVRSGGHGWFTASNVDGGVTIDLSMLKWTCFDAASETVDIGPGGRWRDVYAELDRYGHTVAGARDGSVGVGGMIVGGGISFHSGRRGFACDDVVSFEVVLANGQIVTASASEHRDLFLALKGGSNNFGIVTNYKMRTFEHSAMYGGLKLFNKQYTAQAADALVRFTKNAGSNPDSHMMWLHTYKPEYNDTVVVAAIAQTNGETDAPAYDDLKSLPASVDTCKPTTVLDAISEYEVAPHGYHSSFQTATFGNDARVVIKATELHEQFVDELKTMIPNGDFASQCQFQPLPKSYGQISARKGGNALGLQNQQVDGLVLAAMVQVKTPEQQAFVKARVQAWLSELKAFAATIKNGNLDFVYLNFAGESQDPLRSYGADSVRAMKLAAAKYDPEAVFQNLCKGGFKISHV